jgi:hypothetical protein
MSFKIPRYLLLKRNLIALLISTLILFFSVIVFFILNNLLKNKHIRDNQKICLDQVMYETQRLQNTLCKDRGYDEGCPIDNLPNQDVEIFVQFYETGKNNCQLKYPTSS